MEAITVKELLAAVHGELLQGDETAQILGVNTDSRTVKAGEVFLPLVGERFDGHDYIEKAISAGAEGCLCARVPETLLPGKFYIKVPDTLLALKDLAAWYRAQFSIPFVQVTGSVGKTTTKEMIASVLGVKFHTLKTAANYNNEIGTPQTLLGLSRAHQAAVIETGMDRAGQIRYLGEMVKPDIAVITNVGDMHIEYLGSRENILKAKCEIFENLKKDGLAVLNGDDELLNTVSLPQKTLRCGLSEHCDVRVSEVEDLGIDGIRCVVTTAKERYALSIPVPGKHMVYSAAMAAAIGEYLGETIQVIPHITDEIKNFIYSVGHKTNADVVITEIGGTAGDIESQPFLEAIRQVSLEVGKENSLFIHVTLVPYLKSSGEHKSKPTQHSVKEMQGMGISPDIIVLRCDEPIDPSIFHKIALFCNVKPDCVIENMTIPVLYEAPIMLEKNNFSSVVCRELNLKTKEPDMSEWSRMVEKIRGRKKTVTIGLVGKYIKLHDAYLSVVEALNHAGYEHGTKVEINWIDSELITQENAAEMLKGCDGILVPGGFGNRGIEGMIYAAQYARESNVPYLGICLGMQIAVIEYARHVCGIADANSGEFDEYGLNKVIDFMPDQSSTINMGGTLRLGSYPCEIAEGTQMARCYGVSHIDERHRHRYEFNNDYRETLTKAGMVISGTSPDGRIVETVEVPQNDFCIGVQFHPEFKSRPNKAHPLFLGFVGASLHKREKNA